MKNEMQDIDKLIKETLTEEEAKFYEELDEQNLIEMFKGIFNTKHRWLIIFMNVLNLIIFGLMIYCLIQFFEVENTNDLIKWGLGTMICLVFSSMIKLFSWLQMDKNALLREIKRLELQISSLATKMS